jgi:hypothetical protein
MLIYSGPFRKKGEDSESAQTRLFLNQSKLLIKKDNGTTDAHIVTNGIAAARSPNLSHQ